MTIALFGGLSVRRRRPEIMDEPGLDRARHHHALRGLARINWWSRSAAAVWGPVAALAREVRGAPVRVLDVAAGAGDVPVRLWHKARRAGLAVEVAGCDRSMEAVAHARRRAAAAGADVRFFEWDALAGPLPEGYDAVVSSLFLHHLDAGPAAGLLTRMARAAGRLVLVNDLVRGRAGYLLAWLGTRLLTRSEVVHVDGPRSVEGAFTVDEVRALAGRAGLAGAVVERRWPCRFLLTWRRP